MDEQRVPRTHVEFAIAMDVIRREMADINSQLIVLQQRKNRLQPFLEVFHSLARSLGDRSGKSNGYHFIRGTEQGEPVAVREFMGLHESFCTHFDYPAVNVHELRHEPCPKTQRPMPVVRLLQQQTDFASTDLTTVLAICCFACRELHELERSTEIVAVHWK